MSREYEEKRDYIRMNLESPMSFKLLGGVEVTHGTARDLSATGMQLHCNREIPAGAILEVSVGDGLATVPPLRAEVEVRRVTALGGGLFELGTQIRKML